MNYNRIADLLDKAAFSAQSIPQISHQHSINLNEAYAIQSISLSKRYQRGERPTGFKMGFTSRAKMEQMGVHDLIWGRLTDKMAYQDKGTISISDFIQPRAEPEIAFLVKSDILDEVTANNVQEYVSHVAVAIEIIDTRYRDFKFSLEDVVADNSSSAGYVIGQWHPADVRIEDIPISFEIDGQTMHHGLSSAILENPWNAMVAAARLVKERAEVITADSIVLAGAATPSCYISVGQTITATAEGLGSVTIKTI